MSDSLYCCPICGAPITEEMPRESWIAGPAPPWIRDAILLSDRTPALEEPGCEVTCEDGVYLTKATTTTDEDVEKVEFYVNGSEESVSVGLSTSPEEPCLIAVHQACWDIAKRVVAAGPEVGAEAGSVTSMRKLYEVLHARMRRCEFPYQLLEPHNYFIEGYPSSEDWGSVWWCDTAETDPWSIPDPTDFVISLLKPLPPADSTTPSLSHASLKTSIENIPVDIADPLIDQLTPFRNLPLQCTRVLPQAYWTKALLSGRAFPWLWDLDFKKVEEKLATSTSTETSGWDVERLVRLLSQRGFPYYHVACGDTSWYTHALFNRYRIWRLVEEMRIGDLGEDIGEGHYRHPH